MNGYKLTNEVKEEYLPIIKEFIDKLEKNEEERYNLSLELTGSKLNPYTLGKILEELGYEKDDGEENGWQMDFWIWYEKEDSIPLEIRGTGITFEMHLNYHDKY